MQITSDKELIRRCIQGKTKAQIQLYERHSPFLFTVAYRIVKDKMLAEDIIQEVFIKLFKQLKEIKKPESIKFWLKRGVINKSIDEWKRGKKIIDLNIEAIKDKEEAEENLGIEYNWEDILQKMEKLKEPQRIVLELFYLQEYSHYEIAENLQITNSNSRVLLNRAKKNLKKLVQNER